MEALDAKSKEEFDELENEIRRLQNEKAYKIEAIHEEYGKKDR